MTTPSVCRNTKKHFLLFFSSGCKFNNQSLKGRFLITFKPKDSVLKWVFYMYVKGRYTIEPTYGNFFILYRWIQSNVPKFNNYYSQFIQFSCQKEHDSTLFWLFSATAIPHPHLVGEYPLQIVTKLLKYQWCGFLKIQ